MAYFSNSDDGANFYEQCGRCIYGEEYCPVAFVQSNYNYEACNNEIARKILDALVNNDGTCEVFKMANKDFDKTKDENQLTLFDTCFPELAERERNADKFGFKR